MKICIPVESDTGLSSPVCEHFGRAPFFILFDTESKNVTSFSNSGHHHGGTMSPAEVVLEQDVNVILTSGLGSRAIRLFESKNVEVHLGASGTAEQAIEQYEAGGLSPATMDGACKDSHGH